MRMYDADPVVVRNAKNLALSCLPARSDPAFLRCSVKRLQVYVSRHRYETERERKEGAPTSANYIYNTNNAGTDVMNDGW